MCDPISIAITALGVGEAAAQHIGTNQAYHANKLAANLNYAQDMNVAGQKAGQLDREKSEAAFDTAIVSAQAGGAIAASAADQGLGAPSIAQALHSDMFGIGRQQSIADLNDLNARTQLAQERTGADITRQSTIASKSRSGLVPLGLGVGNAALKGYNSYSATKRAGQGRGAG